MNVNLLPVATAMSSRESVATNAYQVRSVIIVILRIQNKTRENDAGLTTNVPVIIPLSPTPIGTTAFNQWILDRAEGMGDLDQD